MLSTVKRWEVYMGLSQEKSVHLFKGILESRGIPYQISTSHPHFMYDDQHEKILIRTSDFHIQFIYVSADPLTRLFSNVMGISKQHSGITLLSCTFKKQSKQSFYSVMKSFVQNAPSDPWHITSHPRFRFAVLLQLITKYKWKRIDDFVNKRSVNHK